MNAIDRWLRRCMFALLLCAVGVAQAQTMFPLGSNGQMGLGSGNGVVSIEQEDMSVKVPGGYVRIHRDFDGTTNRWVFNRQWSGLGSPSFYRAHYPSSMGSYFSCSTINGVGNCDTTASPGSTQALMPSGGLPEVNVAITRIPNDPNFGRDGAGNPIPDPGTVPQIARKGVGFTRASDGLSYTNKDYPRVVIRPLSVKVLPPSTGPDNHPSTGKPGQGGVATTLVNGFRWVDRSGNWIEYDNFGRVSSYGDRNDVRVWFQYGSHGQAERILDDNGRTVFTLLYKDNGHYVTEVRDHTPFDDTIRRVQYRYDDKGRLDQVTDVRGYTTRFEYAPQSKPSSGGTIIGSSTGSGSTGSTGSTGVVQLPGSGGSTTIKEEPFTTGYEIAKVHDAEGRITEFRYSSTARLRAIVAPDGGVTEFDYEYDKAKKEFGLVITRPLTESGRLRERGRYDQEGRLVLYEANGKPILKMEGTTRSAKFTDMRGSSTQITRDAFDQTTGRINPDGSRVSYKYASNSLDLVEYVDESGLVTKIRYDGFGGVRSVDVGAGLPEAQRTEYITNGRGEYERIIRKGGPRPDGGIDQDADVRMEYDDHGNVSKLTDGEGHDWLYEYNALGQITKVTDPNLHVSTFEYDASGNVLKTTDANNHSYTYTYDKTDRPLTVTDPRSKIGRMSYDEAGRLQRLVDPTGGTTQLQYDKANQLVSMTDAEGIGGQLFYDNFGRKRRFVDGMGNQISTDYADPDGVDRGSTLPTKVTMPGVTRLVYRNARGWLTQASVTGGDQTITQRYEYDVRGAVREFVGTTGKRSLVTYDALGRPVTQTDPEQNLTRLDYDHRDNVVRVTDARTNSTTMVYDRRNKLLSETNPLNLTTRYEYDPAGRLTKLIRPSGVSITLVYDDGGRVLQRIARRADGTVEGTDEFDWDPSGNMTAWSNAEASAVLAYDDNNLLLSEAVTRSGVTLTRSYTYYANKQIRTYTGPDGATVQYVYNRNGQLDKIEIPGVGAISVTNRQWLSPTEVVYPGGSRLKIVRDAFGDAVDVNLTSPGQVERFSQFYQRGPRGELLQRRTDGRTTAFTYDDNLQLQGVDASGFGNDQDFTLDAVGNRETENGVSGEWQYDGANRLLSRGTISYGYDDDGNLVLKTDTSLTGARRVTRYRYDSYNRLREVLDSDEQAIARYSYDPFGYRLTKEITTVGASRSGATAGTTLFLQGAEGVLAEAGVDGAIRRTYGWAPENWHGTMPVYLRQNGETYFYVADAMGTPARLIDAAGVVVWAADYEAFGKAELANTNLIDQPWRLPGQYFDQETGLYYNLHRYYDPEIGRYITSDPIGLDGGINTYLYAGASPTLFSDPRGLFVPAVVVGAAAWGILDVAIQDMMSDQPNDITWEDYVGGAVGGIVSLPFGGPIIGGMVYGGVSNGISQALKIASGKQDKFYFCDWLASVGANALGGAGARLLKAGAGPLMKRLGARSAAKSANAVAGASSKAAARAANGVDDLAKAAGRACNNSFDQDTLVQTDRGLVRIIDLKVGDKVLARNELTGEESYQEVQATHVNWHATTLTVEVAKGDAYEAIITTDEHPFFVFGKGFIPAAELQAGDMLLLANSQRAVVVSARVNEAGQLAYNLTVANAHTYFVGQSGVWVHNCDLFPNQLPERLASEMAEAASAGAKPILAGSPGFADALNEGTIKWVVTEGGGLVISPHTVNGVEISHAVLSGGRPVLAAGQADISTAGGVIFPVGISPHSGHFMPSLESLNIGKQAFARYGIHF
ncbi:MAG TPA: polymorphic toxin-type HINT domain-containing protein [Xanthomonadaceae bacterium]